MKKVERRMMFRRDWYEVVYAHGDRVRLELYDTLFANLFDLQEPPIGPEATIAWELIRNEVMDEIERRNKSVKEPKKDLDTRRDEFKAQVKKFRGKYPEEILSSFYKHWAESNDGGKKMRWEMERVFSLKDRLAFWASRPWNRPKEVVPVPEETKPKNQIRGIEAIKAAMSK